MFKHLIQIINYLSRFLKLDLLWKIIQYLPLDDRSFLAWRILSKEFRENTFQNTETINFGTSLPVSQNVRVRINKIKNFWHKLIGTNLLQSNPALIKGLNISLLSYISSGGNYLTYLANYYGTDKGTLYPNYHNYTHYYHSYFLPLQNKKNLRLLEIGLCIGFFEKWEQSDIPSIKMWLKYFPHAQIYGIDISDFSSFEYNRVKIFQGDQGKQDDLQAFIQQQGGNFDIIIDDGSHLPGDQQISLGTLFPYLNSGGYYVIEDLDHQGSNSQYPGILKTEKILCNFQEKNFFESEILSSSQNEYLTQHIESLNIFTKNTDKQSPCNGIIAFIKKCNSSEEKKLL